jgi:predicted DNA-binding protein (UPF0251 family)
MILGIKIRPAAERMGMDDGSIRERVNPARSFVAAPMLYEHSALVTIPIASWMLFV